ncbi:sigma-54-dependent Fis family transcriptional regulator [Allostella vacuolata]|nr:sigma-54-dependent Fis family transcriptional regulator [Stella vacuolata]
MTPPPRILLIEDDPILGPALMQRLRLEGFDPVLAATAATAIAAAAARPPDAIISDIRLPDMSGETVFRRLLDSAAAAPTFFVTAFGEVAQAVRLVKAGARDYLIKPVDVDALVAAVRAATSSGAATEEDAGPGLGRSPAMRAVEAFLAKTAALDLPVLLLGETGVGKEVAARFLHARSGRPGPFAAINCAAIPRELLESTVFGHEKGAFTGATARHAGLAETAAGGTLFLDEVAELPAEMQAKLLRLVQERTYRPVGGGRELAFEGRLVFATHADLPALVASGAFRQDFYYRINVLEIVVPPLRQRPEDLADLAARFLRAADERLGRGPHHLAPAALARLAAHAWPGNVRELRNRVERAAALADHAEIGPADLFPEQGLATPGGEDGDRSLQAAVDEAARRRIAAALRDAGGNRSEAARLLGISRTTLWKRMQELGL